MTGAAQAFDASARRAPNNSRVTGSEVCQPMAIQLETTQLEAESSTEGLLGPQNDLKT